MAYATVDELAAEMTLDNPTSDQITSMQRSLDAAAAEIDWFLGYDLAGPPDPVPVLVVQVNLDRAHEHFDQTKTPFGMVGIGTEAGPIPTGPNGWRRHARKLAPLKMTFGVA